MKTLVETVYEHSKGQPDHLAVVVEDEALTYEELWAAILSAADVLRQNGVRRGDVVVAQSTYTKYYPAALFATHLLGAAFVSSDKSAAPELIVELAQQLHATLIVSNADIPDFPSVSFADLSNGCASALEEPYVFPALDDVSDILFTTGTTGTPKGVVLTHKNMAAKALTRAKATEIKKNNVTVSLSPLNHHAAMLQLYVNMLNGSTVIFLDGIMQLNKMFRYIPLYGITSIYLPPANVSLIEKLTHGKLSEYKDVLDFVYISSASIRDNQKEYMKCMLPNSRLYYSYGSSENGTVSVFDFNHCQKPNNCVGKPCDGVSVLIVDERFLPKATDEIGRIAIKSDMNFKEYYHNPTLTEQVYHDGYFLTNDAGFMDKDGFLYVIGRTDDMINIGGLKVFPSEIEDLALELDEIQECVCFSVPDAASGQVPKLLIVPKTSPDAVNVRVVAQKLAQKMDAYKVPKYIEIVDDIQRTPNGKINRKYYQQQ